MMRGLRKNNKGFSFIELVMALAIISILAMTTAPTLIRYINKARKAVDCQTGYCIYVAANLAAATAREDVAAGWDACTAKKNGGTGQAVYYATPDGHSAGSNSKKGNYQIIPVAWARGIRKDYQKWTWDNALFKVAYDDLQAKQQPFVDEFILNTTQGRAVGGTTGNRKYSGYSQDTYFMRCKKDSGRGKPECWILYRRSDNATPEVWIGMKPSGKVIQPLYRIYPDPCEEYAAATAQ